MFHASKLVLGEGLGDELEGLRLRSPRQGLGELVNGLGDVTVIGVQVLLEDDLRGDMALGIGKGDAPDLGEKL
ncbi:hypothetical protein HYQ46_001489 [Verticillium longisporum]|nr:hypothetical protein HYQ46_001489 [Verticillium longisporum]